MFSVAAPLRWMTGRREIRLTSFVHYVLITNTFLWSTKYQEYSRGRGGGEGGKQKKQEKTLTKYSRYFGEVLEFKPTFLRFTMTGQTQYFGRHHRWDTQAHWIAPAGHRTSSFKVTICKITARRVLVRIRRTRRRSEAKKYLRSAATQQSKGTDRYMFSAEPWNALV